MTPVILYATNKGNTKITVPQIKTQGERVRQPVTNDVSVRRCQSASRATHRHSFPAVDSERHGVTFLSANLNWIKYYITDRTLHLMPTGTKNVSTNIFIMVKCLSHKYAKQQDVKDRNTNTLSPFLPCRSHKSLSLSHDSECARSVVSFIYVIHEHSVSVCHSSVREFLVSEPPRAHQMFTFFI